MSSNHARQSRKPSRDVIDIDLAVDDDDGPPRKRIKLNPDDEDTCQEFKLLSQTMNTIYNRLQHPSDTSKCEVVWRSMQMNEIIDSLLLTHIMDPEYCEPGLDRSRTSSVFNKFLRDFYRICTIQFVQKWYTNANIYSIYNGWKQYNTSSLFRVNEAVKSELMAICEKQRNKYMKSTDILAPIQLLISDGYIRRHAAGLAVPQCISQAISVYYEPISWRCKIPQLFESELDELVTNIHTIEHNIFEVLDRLERVFPMVRYQEHRSVDDYHFLFPYESFYIVKWKFVEKIIRGMSDVWNKQYLLGQIGIMEYTKKIEEFMERADDNYQLEQKAGIGILIPSYNQCILDKYNGDYNTLVMALSKPELKRIYRVLMRTNSAEGGKLNAAYKSAHCQ
eukprot:841914_1